MQQKQPYLAPDEAALLAVFDPKIGHTREMLLNIAGRDTKTVAAVCDAKFRPIIDIANSASKSENPWTSEPRCVDGVLLLRLRKFREGSAAPQVREISASMGLAVFDLTSQRVFAPEELQKTFEKGEWEIVKGPNANSDWLYAGCFLLHTKFGKGRLLDIGEYKGANVLLIKFANCTRLIDPKYGLPHIRPSD